MTRKYRTHAPHFKLKVALEAAKNEKTINQIAAEYAISPAQAMEWKKHLLTEGASIFQSKKTTHPTEAHEDVACLQQQIGKLSVQIEWLKKKQGIAL